MITSLLLKKKYLRRISRVKYEKFGKCVSKLKAAWGAAQKWKRVAGRPYVIGELREHLLLLLYYRTYTTHLFFCANFQGGWGNDLPSDMTHWAASFERSFVKISQTLSKLFTYCATTWGYSPQTLGRSKPSCSGKTSLWIAIRLQFIKKE